MIACLPAGKSGAADGAPKPVMSTAVLPTTKVALAPLVARSVIVTFAASAASVTESAPPPRVMVSSPSIVNVSADEEPVTLAATLVRLYTLPAAPPEMLADDREDAVSAEAPTLTAAVVPKEMEATLASCVEPSYVTVAICVAFSGTDAPYVATSVVPAARYR